MVYEIFCSMGIICFGFWYLFFLVLEAGILLRNNQTISSKWCILNIPIIWSSLSEEHHRSLRRYFKTRLPITYFYKPKNQRRLHEEHVMRHGMEYFDKIIKIRILIGLYGKTEFSEI